MCGNPQYCGLLRWAEIIMITMFKSIEARVEVMVPDEQGSDLGLFNGASLGVCVWVPTVCTFFSIVYPCVNQPSLTHIASSHVGLRILSLINSLYFVINFPVPG